MKTKTTSNKWQMLAGLVVTILYCAFFAQLGMAQVEAEAKAESKITFHINETNPSIVDNVLVLSVGELVTLQIDSPEPLPNEVKIHWELESKEGDSDWKGISVDKDKLSALPFQLYENSKSTTGNSKDVAEARINSYVELVKGKDAESKDKKIPLIVSLKATKVIPSNTRYRVCLCKDGKDNKNNKDELFYSMEIAVKGPPAILLISKDLSPKDTSSKKPEETNESYFIEAGTRREFRVQIKPESGGDIDIKEVAIMSSAAGKLIIVDTDNKEQPSFHLDDKSHSVDIAVIALQNSDEPVNLTVTNQIKKSIINSDSLVKKEIPFHIIRPKISITPDSLSFTQNAKRRVTVNIDKGDSGLHERGKIQWDKSTLVDVQNSDIDSNLFILHPKSAGKFVLKAKYVLDIDPNIPSNIAEKISLPSAEALLNLVVRPNPGIVLFDGPSTLLIGRSEIIKITLYDQSFQPVSSEDKYRFTVRSADPEIMSVRRHPEQPGSVEVTALKPGVVKLEVLVDGVPLDDTWELRAATVSEFKPVRVALNIMDDKTAADLFGKETSQEFYAVRVRIFNNLDRDVDGRFLGKSILAYSESIEASVGLEIKEAPLFTNGKEKKKYEANIRKIKEFEESGIEREIKNTKEKIKKTDNDVERQELQKQLEDYQLKLVSRQRVDLLDTWHELSPQDPAITQNYDLPMANPDNPYPFGLVTATDAKYKEVSSALGSGVTARKGNAHLVEELNKGEKVTFILPEGVSPSPGGGVYWWNEDDKNAGALGKPVVKIDQNLGIVTMENPGVTMISVIVGNKRYSRVIEVVGSKKFSTDLKQVRLYPVSQLESGNNMVIAWEEGKGTGTSPGKINWEYLNDRGASPQERKFTLTHNDEELFATGVIDGTEAIISEKPKTGKDKQRYAAVISVTLFDSATNLPPSVYIDSNGQPKYFRHLFRYRPYTFEMMVNSAPERNKRDGTIRKVNLLNGLLSATSIYSLFRRNNNTAQDLGLLGGFLPPLIKSYSPDMSDAQRQNFVAMTMKPLEEIPFGSDVSRVIFFPKTPFRGMVKDHLTRINRIDTSYFNITVSILDKSTATLNAVMPDSTH